MQEQLYVVGEKVAGGYPGGQYVTRRFEGKMHDHYIVVGVLEAPSVRAVANSDAWSGAEVKEYESIVSIYRDDRFKAPEKYEGEWADDSFSEYRRSLARAYRRQARELLSKGDREAVDRIQEIVFSLNGKE